MDISFFQSKFLETITSLDIGNLEFYQFGSSIHKSFFRDIDILIIYDNYEIMKVIKQTLIKELKICLPHITCLSTKEETELSFIKATQAQKLYPILETVYS